MISRRRFIASSTLGAGLAAGAVPRWSLAAAPDARLAIVLLRGGMDGLTAVPAPGDPDHERSRRGLAIEDTHPLDGFFALDGRLSYFANLWREGSLAPVHACCVPYLGRSHFDAQNVLETGSATPYGLRTGWLNRALAGLPTDAGDLAVGITQTMPVILRGEARVTSWFPSALPEPDADTVDRIADLYADDTGLAQALAAARRIHERSDLQGSGRGGAGLASLMAAAGTFLADRNGPRVAMLESSGWDSHANQGLAQGGLNRNFTALDHGVDAMRQALGAAWTRTAVIVVTEFGRTVAMNGTRGTDHGTGGAAFVLGGAVAGGRVIADWPGLRARDLLEGRDLRPTTDLRAILKAALIEHLGIAEGRVEEAVFPDSRRIEPLSGLFRKTV